MDWLDKIRAWPQRKKMNLIWIITGASVIIMIIIWIIVGNYRVKGAGSASANIGSIITNIKNNGNGASK